jgi:hypothetical protein
VDIVTGVCLERIKAERCLLEGLKGIVRELSFAGDSEKFGGSFCCFCGLLQNEKRGKEASNVLDS